MSKLDSLLDMLRTTITPDDVIMSMISKVKTDMRIPAYPDSESGFIRTRFRQHPDSVPEGSGHLSGDLIVLCRSFPQQCF